ncbi:MAG: hypothetical protein QOE58_542, partial [Actinomycetota bacterium]|nr:hypothetical protein [Actinomycetota bacterium]
MTVATSLPAGSTSPAGGAELPVGSTSPAVAAEVMAQLALLLGAGGSGGLSGMDGDQVLRVVEAAETVRSWADSVSLTATAALVGEVEKDFADLGVKRTARIWTRFVRGCRSAVAKDIMV